MFYGVASLNQAKRMNKFVNLLLLEIYSLLHILWLTDHSVAKLASKPIFFLRNHCNVTLQFCDDPLWPSCEQTSHCNFCRNFTVLAGVVVVVFFGYRYWYSDKIVPEFSLTNTEVKSEGDTKIKQDIADSGKDDDGVKEGDLKITVEGKPVIVHYKQAEPDVCSLDVLFLHGEVFTSKTWVTEPMNSLQHLSKLGYNVVAIDLPGYGESPKASVDPASYLEVVIKRLKLKKPVIVSPSMSGRFSLPFLFKEPIVDRCLGFVPVAPVGTGKYTKDQYENLEVPTLFIRGTEDTSYGLSSQEDLQQLPNFKLKEYEGAGHPAYLHNPERFHKDLDTFFKELLATKE